jgi:hypothetical protein
VSCELFIDGLCQFQAIVFIPNLFLIN